MIIDTKLSIHKSNGNAELAKELLSMLINDLPKSLASINQLFQLNQNDELKECVHRVLGSISYCGVPNLKIAIQNLDKSIKNNNKTEIKFHINDLELKINELTQHAIKIMSQQW